MEHQIEAEIDNIVLAKNADLDGIMTCYSKCIAKMHRQNIFQWDEDYPNREIIKKDIELSQLFIVKELDEVLAVVCLNDEQHPTYKSIKWSFGSNALVVHRLAVNPDTQGKGLAKKLMIFSEKKALELGYEGIRLDTFVENEIAIDFYLKLGYKKLDLVSFKNRTYFCFDKKI